MGWKGTALPDPSLKKHCVKCLTIEENNWKPYNDNLCLFRALALHLHENERLEEETSKVITILPDKSAGTDRANFWGVCMEAIAAVEDIEQADSFLYDFDLVGGCTIGELARRRVGKHCITVRLYGYYAIIVTFAMSWKSTLSSKLIVVNRAINSSKWLSTWSNAWPLAKKELNMFFQGKCMNCEKHYLTI